MIAQANSVDPFQRQHLARFGPSRPLARESWGLLACFPPSRSGAASSRKSISMATERAQRIHHFDQAQAARLGGKSLGGARREKDCVEVGLEAPLDAGAQDFDRHRAFVLRYSISALWTCAIEAAATAARRCIASADAACRTPRRPSPRLRPAETAPSCPAGIRDRARSRADHIGPCGEELPELDVSRPEPGQRRREAVLAGFCGRPLNQPGKGDCGLGG